MFVATTDFRDSQMKKTWHKPEIQVEATGMEVTSYEQADIDPEILF